MAAALILAVAISPPSGASASQTLTYFASEARVQTSSLSTVTEGSALLVSPGPGLFNWTLDVEALTVNWTRHTFLVYESPSGSKHEYGLGATSGERKFGQSQATSQATGHNSAVLVDGGPAFGISLGASSSQVRPAGAEFWELKSNSSALAARVDLEPGQAEVIQQDGIAVLSGNFSLHVWDANVTIAENGAQTSFRSGTWTDPAGPASQLGMKYRYYQTLRLSVYAGSLQIHLLDRAAHSAGTEVAFGGALSLQLANASTNAAVDQNSPVSMKGNLSVVFRNETTLQNRLSASITQIETIAANPGPLQPVSGPEVAMPGRGQTPPSWIGMSIATIGSLGVALLVARHRTVSIDDVEWALFEKKSRRARRLARRLVKRTPKDATAVFLYATSLLAMDRYTEIVSQVVPLVERLSAKKRVGTAYVLARACSELQDAQGFRRWAGEAAKEPKLKSQLHRDGLLISASFETQSGYA